jgi:hypothetical protein
LRTANGDGLRGDVNAGGEKLEDNTNANAYDCVSPAPTISKSAADDVEANEELTALDALVAKDADTAFNT